MNKSIIIEILHSLDNILKAMELMEISDGCANKIERYVLNIKTIIFCSINFFMNDD